MIVSLLEQEGLPRKKLKSKLQNAHTIDSEMTWKLFEVHRFHPKTHINLMLEHWLELEEELHNSFYVIAIHTSFRPYRLAYALNKNLHIQLKRSHEDLDLKRYDTDFHVPVFEYNSPNYFHQYDLIGNRSIRIGKSDGIIHYEEVENNLYSIGYLIPEHRKVDYFLKVDFDDNCLPLKEALHRINKIRGVQSAYILNNSQIKSINNLIFD